MMTVTLYQNVKQVMRDEILPTFNCVDTNRLNLTPTERLTFSSRSSTPLQIGEGKGRPYGRAGVRCFSQVSRKLCVVVNTHNHTLGKKRRVLCPLETSGRAHRPSPTPAIIKPQTKSQGGRLC